MPSLKFNDISIKRLPVPKAGRVDYWDSFLSGFGCRVNHTGTKTWMVNVCTLVNGKRTSGKRIKVGRYPDMTLADARTAAHEAMEAARKGGDPTRINRQQTEGVLEKSRDSFGAVAKDFIKRHVERNARRESTARAYRTALMGQDVTDWQKRPVAEITKRDIRERLEQIHARAPILANRTLAYWSKFFSWCLSQEIIDIDPTNGVAKPAEERQGNRVLSLDEIGELLDALDPKNIMHKVFLLLLLTGQRRDEIASLSWDEVFDLDGDNPRIELSEDRTKNHRLHIVPLSPQAAAVIKSTSRIMDCDYVFSTTGKSPVTGFSKAKAAVDQQIAAARKRNELKPMPDWTLHDLRRTCATHMHETLEIEPHVVEAVLNHISGAAKQGVAGVYNKAAYLPQRRTALSVWAERLENIKVIAETGS